MSKRVSLYFDDGTKIDFNNEADAVNHLKVQGAAGAVNLKGEDDGKVVLTRAQLNKAARGDE